MPSLCVYLWISESGKTTDVLCMFALMATWILWELLWQTVLSCVGKDSYKYPKMVTVTADSLELWSRAYSNNRFGSLQWLQVTPCLHHEQVLQTYSRSFASSRPASTLKPSLFVRNQETIAGWGELLLRLVTVKRGMWPDSMRRVSAKTLRYLSPRTAWLSEPHPVKIDSHIDFIFLHKGFCPVSSGPIQNILSWYSRLVSTNIYASGSLKTRWTEKRSGKLPSSERMNRRKL